jgi:hypothetical protein
MCTAFHHVDLYGGHLPVTYLLGYPPHHVGDA